MNTTWTQERSPNLLWILSSVYGVTFFLYFANFYSAGVPFSTLSILLAAIVLGPIFGFLSFGLTGYLLERTGKWLGGSADFASLRVAVACSTAPASLLVVIWTLLLILDPAHAFIQDASNASAVTIVFGSFFVSLWSFILLFKHVRALQGFSAPRALLNVAMLYVLSTLVYTAILFAGRFIYLRAM